MPLLRSQPARALLQLSRGRWRLRPLENGSRRVFSAQEGAWTRKEPSELAKAVQATVGEDQTTELVVALDSDLCLAARFTAPSRKQLRSASALLYQLEETLPVAAEEVVADFRIRGNEVFTVACERDWLEAVCGLLRSEGCLVRAVAPLQLLALSEHVRRNRSSGDHLVSWRRERRHDLVACRGGEPVDWQTSVRDDSTIDQLLLAHGFDNADETPVVTYAGTEDVDSLETQAAATAEKILRGEANPLVSLSPSSVGSGQLMSSRGFPWVHAAALLLLAAVAWRFHSMAVARQQAADKDANLQAEVFREVFPERRVPVGVRSHLASELRRLKGVRGEEGSTPQRRHAVLLVQDLLAAMPQAMRLRVLEVRVEEGRVYVEGQARSYGDADRVAAALRQAGFNVSSPSTQQLPDKGVDFRLTAETGLAVSGEAS